MQRDPINCPSCGAEFDPLALVRPRRARAAASQAKAKAEEKAAAPEEENADEEDLLAADDNDEALEVDDDIDLGDDGDDDLCHRLRGTVLKGVPDELPEPRVLRQHVGGDQHHPTHTERKPQPREYVGQGRRQHDLEQPLLPIELQNLGYIQVVRVDRCHANRRVDQRRPQRAQSNGDRRTRGAARGDNTGPANTETASGAMD